MRTPLVRRADRALTRLGLRGPVSRDAAAAAAWTVVSVIVLAALLAPVGRDLGFPVPPGGPWPLLAVVAAQTLLLTVRRVAPVVCLWLVATAQIALVALAPPDTSIHLAAPLVVAYTAGTLLPIRRLVPVIVGAVVLEAGGGAVAVAMRGGTAGALTAPADAASALLAAVVTALSALLIYGVSALVGLVVALRREQVRSLRERAAQVEIEQRARADSAISAERARMARELHDIAAHHLSGIVVQAGAVERLIDQDPEAAKSTTRSIRAQGRDTLDDLRMLVGVLRERESAGVPHGSATTAAEDHSRSGIRSDADDSGQPVPGLAMLDTLVGTARDRGDRIAMRITGAAVRVAPIADVTAYRVAQEALTNARQHAPGAAVTVELDYRADGVVLEVRNAAGRPTEPTARPGFGLLGMRERAAVAGARLDAEPSADGGWRVRLALPRPATDRDEAIR